MKFLVTLLITVLVFTYFNGVKAMSVDSLKIEFKSATDVQDSMGCLIALTKYYQSISIDSTFYYGQLAIIQAEKLKDTASLAQVYKYLGISCYYAALYEKSLEYSQKSNELYKKLNDINGVAKTYNNMGVIYEVSGKYDIALEHYNNSVKIWHRINEGSPDDPETKRIIANLYNNIGIVYANISKKEKAKDYYNKSYAIAKQYNDKKCMSQTLSNLGNVLFAEKEHQRALEDLFESLRLIESLDDKYSLVISLGAISDVYLKLKNYDKAHLYLDRALSIAKDINANELIKDAYKGLYLIYKETGKHETALKYQTLYYQLHDSIYSQKSKSKIAELQNKYIFEKKEQEIKLLEAEQKMNDIQLRNSRILLYVLIGGILVLMSFLGLIYYQLRQKKQANKELVHKNLEIVQTEEYVRRCLTRERDKALSEIRVTCDKYASSTLSVKQKENLKLRIIDSMDKEKPYLKPDFTINIFAKDIDVSRSYISQVINEYFDMNFNVFINGYRIKEARRMLTDKANKNLTIVAIANAVGFASKSSFNNAFKKYTGVTPSFYLKNTK